MEIFVLIVFILLFLGLGKVLKDSITHDNSKP